MSALPPDGGSAEWRVRAMVESLPHLVWTCRGDGPCDYLSPQWLEYTGICEEEQLGYGWLEQTHPEDRSPTQELWMAATAAQETFDTEFRIRRFDGVYRWFKTRAIPEVKEGRITKWFGTNTDIQELKDAQQTAAALARQLASRITVQTTELRAANDRLTTLTLQLQTAQRLTRVGSWELDIATGKVTWSSELFRVFGLDSQREPPNYQVQATLFDESSWTRLTAAIEHSVATGTGYELTLTAIRVDGEKRTTIARAEALVGRDGTVEALVGTFQDITDQQAAANRLAQVSERLQLATSAARIGVWEWDIPTNSLVWDDAMHQIYDTREESFTGAYEAWTTTVHPDDLKPAELLLQQAVQGQAEFRTVFRILRRNGEVRYIRAESSLYRDKNGQVARMIGVNWDITEQRTAELALRHTEALQSGILSAAGSAIIATTTTGVVTLFNPAAEHLLGYSAEEVVGKLTPGVFHYPAEVEALGRELEVDLGRPFDSPFEVLVEKSRAGKPYATEWTYVRKDGSHLPVWLTISALLDGDEIVGYLGLASDLTSRKDQEIELRELNTLLAQRSSEAEAASHAKSMFVANMSHELRTPIGAITGVTYLLARTDLSSEQRDLVGTIERSTRSLLDMVNDVLDLAKIEAGQLSLELEDFSLKEVLVHIASLMAAYSAAKEIELVVNADPDLPNRLLGDRVRLMQILTNLIGNAVKFTDKGEVRLSASPATACNRDYQCLRFEVSDTGPGMQPELLQRLFTPFTQAEQSNANRPTGTGLGLAIVKDLVALMHGEVGVSSQPGKGSSFWFEVPFELAQVPEVDESQKPLKLLIIDDHEAQRVALRSCARALGWSAEVASSGANGLAMIDPDSPSTPFDVIVVDWQMPGMNGLEMLEALNASLGAERPPCLVLAATYDIAKLRTSQNFEFADGFVSKPVTESTLYDGVIQAFENRGRPKRWTPLPHQKAEARRLSGIRVLVADDSDVNRDIARRILELEGATVEQATDGGIAVECVLSGSSIFDLVLMDVQMPVADGVEATRRIRADVRFRDLPIVAVTASALSTERDRALAAGMTDYITKPYEPEAIIARVRGHVKKQFRVRPSLPSKQGSPPGAVWPTIDGIDTADAQRRFGGDIGLFSVLLDRLKGEIDKACAAGLHWEDDAAGRAFLHRLRGTASNLSARKLGDLAREAERTLEADDSTGKERATALNRLRQEMDRIRCNSSVVNAKRATTTRSSGAAPIDEGSLIRVILLLEQRNLEAATLINELSDRFESSLGLERFGALDSMLKQLDYPAARDLLLELAADLKRTHESPES